MIFYQSLKKIFDNFHCPICNSNTFDLSSIFHYVFIENDQISFKDIDPTNPNILYIPIKIIGITSSTVKNIQNQLIDPTDLVFNCFCKSYKQHFFWEETFTDPNFAHSFHNDSNFYISNDIEIEIDYIKKVSKMKRIEKDIRIPQIEVDTIFKIDSKDDLTHTIQTLKANILFQ